MTTTHVLPFVLYLLGTAFIARFGDSAYPPLYTGVVLVVATSLVLLMRKKQILTIHARVAPGILVGLLGILLWICLSELHLEQKLTAALPSWLQPESRVGYNPFDNLSARLAWAFVAVRMLGIAVVVPLVEELFWRGFLLRWLVDPEWERVPLGYFTFSSCALVTLMFTLAHPEWIAAAIYCLLINALLYWKKDLWQCVVAHSVSNLVLALYVLQTGAWGLW